MSPKLSASPASLRSLGEKPFTPLAGEKVSPEATEGPQERRIPADRRLFGWLINLEDHAGKVIPEDATSRQITEATSQSRPA